MALYTYSADQVAIIVGGVPFVGKGEDTFISAEFADDDWSTSVGADGSVVRSLKANNVVDITLTCQQTSPINDLLSVKRNLDRLVPNTGVFAITVKDLLGTSTLFSGTCYVKKAPTMEYAHEATTREWQLQGVDVAFQLGGNLPVSPAI